MWIICFFDFLFVVTVTNLNYSKLIKPVFVLSCAPDGGGWRGMMFTIVRTAVGGIVRFGAALSQPRCVEVVLCLWEVASLRKDARKIIQLGLDVDKLPTTLPPLHCV